MMIYECINNATKTRNPYNMYVHIAYIEYDNKILYLFKYFKYFIFFKYFLQKLKSSDKEENFTDVSIKRIRKHYDRKIEIK